jgi:mannose-6-phosphate isomerase-like protein (cupin superfamily)
MTPRRSVTTAHVAADEDELSFVVVGSFGVRIGDRVIEVGPGTYLFNQRGSRHLLESRQLRM